MLADNDEEDDDDAWLFELELDLPRDCREMLLTVVFASAPPADDLSSPSSSYTANLDPLPPLPPLIPPPLLHLYSF